MLVIVFYTVFSSQSCSGEVKQLDSNTNIIQLTHYLFIVWYKTPLKKGHKRQYSLLYNWVHEVKCKAPVAKINMTQRQCYCTQHCEFMWSLSALLLMHLQLPFCFMYSSLILQHHTFLSLYYSLVTLVFSWVVLGRLDSGGWHTGSVGGEGRSGEIKRRLHVIACFCLIFCCMYSHAKNNISPVLWKNVSSPLLLA